MDVLNEYDLPNGMLRIRKVGHDPIMDTEREHERKLNAALRQAGYHGVYISSGSKKQTAISKPARNSRNRDILGITSGSIGSINNNA